MQPTHSEIRRQTWLRMEEFVETQRPIALSLPPPVFFFDESRGLDRTAVALVERLAHDCIFVRKVEYALPGVDINRVIVRMTRDVSRPRGYSRSHWRKIWKQTQPQDIK